MVVATLTTSSNTSGSGKIFPPRKKYVDLKLLHQPTKLAQASADKKTDNSLLLM